MSKKKIYVAFESGLSDLAATICSENDYKEIIDLIKEIDAQQQDWEFTRRLSDAVAELMSQETGTRVDSRRGTFDNMSDWTL